MMSPPGTAVSPVHCAAMQLFEGGGLTLPRVRVAPLLQPVAPIGKCATGGKGRCCVATARVQSSNHAHLGA